MITIRKYAAIDIGSNAIRLLISNVIEQDGKPTQFTKNSLVRTPIRLGQDTFTIGKISEENIENIIDALRSYLLLMKIHKVEKYHCCATSAIREAINSQQVVSRIKKETGIFIEIIEGEKEAEIITQAELNNYFNNNQTYFYVDVGGGSTEITLFSQGKSIISKSFKIGTIRLLNNQINNLDWNEMEQWIKSVTSNYSKINLIGSGGNINKLFKLSKKSQNKPLSFDYLNNQLSKISTMSYEQRITELGLNSDRADVIVPAIQIYLNTMKWSGAKQIFVPKIGLADGIIKMIYYDQNILFK